VSRITAGRLGGGHQVGFDGLLPDQACEYPRHHLATLLFTADDFAT
jgi:hypothetical protein